MKTKQVLVISYPEDGSAVLLLRRLKEIGQRCFLIDLSKFPNQARSTIEYSLTGLSLVFKEKNLTFSEKTVKSIWWRRPKGKIRKPTKNPIEKYTETESEIFLNSFFSFFKNAKWVSNPENTRMANFKPLQLKLAQTAGFRIPRTLISNDPEAVANFLRVNRNVPMIMKPVGTSFVRLSEDPEDVRNKNLTIYTRIIDKKSVFKNIDLVSNCPVIFQEAAEQIFDLRVTVIGNKVFAVKIGHSQDLGAGNSNVDWRNHKLKRTFEKYDLPRSIEKMAVTLTKCLGLNFSAIDLAYSKKKGYVFFEINPQGQWMPSETLAGHPISKTLALFLANC